MNNSRACLLLAAAAVTAAAISAESRAQNMGGESSPGNESRTPYAPALGTLRSVLAPSTLGLKPQSGDLKQGIALPYGLNYSSETKSLIMPLDEKNEWGLGLNLNVNSSAHVDQSPSSGLGLQPKRVPGVTLQKRF